MIKKLLIIVVTITIALGIGCGIYISDYYRANETAVTVMQHSTYDTKDVIVLDEDNMAVFLPRDNGTTGIIFYPGGKVEYSAYAPLLYRCAELGITGVLLEMPANLAVLDMNAADGIIEQYPDVKQWYLAGHSLGGAMASSYLAKHKDDYEGIILLAAYATKPLQGEKVMSIYGSEDQVLDLKKYEENRANLPEDYYEIIIEGGCHAFFGSYGIQDGDGMPAISAEEQQELTAQAIAEFVK